ncbi:hypothetical protein LCGC14_2086620 [marine sediment metagenome]|uniref:Uncharacterized protein n=1 Tax=marine sediment metagenome TaxID=412755 RepID=A0A0F9EE97_9ZZZZ
MIYELSLAYIAFLATWKSVDIGLYLGNIVTKRLEQIEAYYKKRKK